MESCYNYWGFKTGIDWLSNLQFSSTVKTDVRPTDSCLSVCLGGEGMWYQHSPVGGHQHWLICLYTSTTVHMTFFTFCDEIIE